MKYAVPNTNTLKALITDFLEHEGYFSTINAVDKQDEKEVQVQKMDQNVFNSQVAPPSVLGNS